jgi:hypothetical protein
MNAVRLYTIDQIDGNADPVTKDIRIECASCDPNSPEHYPSRPARDVLRDYMRKFWSLEWMPGGHAPGDWESDELARLYTENGWPSSFNRTAFQIARQEWKDADHTRYIAEEPFEVVKKFEMWLQLSADRLRRDQEKIRLLDSGGELPEGITHRETYKQELENDISKAVESIPKFHEELKGAKELVKSVDPEVRRVREERIKKYGY